jgi:hypothetical protein
MTRPALLVPALAISALLAAAPVTASETANSTDEAAVIIKFKPDANRGLHAEVEASRGKVRLSIKRKGRYVSYEAPAKITETRLTARFGKLGLIDVAFAATETVVTAEPPKGCEGEPSTTNEGIFTGTIEFTGERNYVRIEEDRVKGKIWVYPESEWQCPRRERSIRDHVTSRVSAVRSRQEFKVDEEPATLFAVRRRCRCSFLAYAVRDRGASGFLGLKFENLEGMEISRVTFAHAGASAFVYDHVSGTARANPPRPFGGGHATFKRRPDRRDLWRSTIRVPLLGAKTLSFPGGGSRAGLRREFPFS